MYFFIIKDTGFTSVASFSETKRGIVPILTEWKVLRAGLVIWNQIQSLISSDLINH